MSVKRIVTNIATEQAGSAHAFYCGVLGMSVAIVPDISIEVDNLDEIYERVRAGGFSVEMVQ